MSRPETGPMRFGDDWTGTFIRGDNAAHYAFALRALLEQAKDSPDVMGHAVLRGLLSDLEGSRHGAEGAPQDVQLLVPFEQAQVRT